MFHRNRAEPGPPAPDPSLMALVETTGAAARSAPSLRDAVGVVLRDVADTAGWTAGHAWARGDEPGTWVSFGLWYPDDGMALGALRHACVEAPAAPARGHLALALHLQGTQFSDLSGWTGTPTYDAALAAGVLAAIACPVYAGETPVALLEWYLPTAAPPSPDVAHVLGHLSSVLSEVAERPVHVAPPRGRLIDVRETLRWVTEDGVVARLLAC